MKNIIPLDETNAVADAITVRSLLEMLSEFVNGDSSLPTYTEQSQKAVNTISVILDLAKKKAISLEKAVLEAV